MVADKCVIDGKIDQKTLLGGHEPLQTFAYNFPSITVND